VLRRVALEEQDYVAAKQTASYTYNTFSLSYHFLSQLLANVKQQY